MLELDMARGKRLRRWGPWFLAAVLLGLGVWWLGDILVGSNLHTVIPGRVYRAAQPTAASLERIVQCRGIRTIVNLRGCSTPLPWYLDEGRVAQECGLSLEDVSFSATHLPSAGELRTLLDVLDRSDYPILLHCRHGSDRTGLAAAIVLALQDDVPYSEARRALGLAYGHLSFGRTGMLDRFFDLYEAWLQRTGSSHSPLNLRHWILEEYRGGWCNGAVTAVQPLGKARAGWPLGFRVRMHNRSAMAWHLLPTQTAGIHVFFHVWDRSGRPVAEGRAGMLDAVVAPGADFDVTLVVPPLETGWHWLTVDLIDENHCVFYQAGSESWEGELIVP